MATWAIGDLQGCYEDFRCLLDKIHFNPDRDQLWLTGDLVNRGPASLETLRFCYDRRDNLLTVLGNHDLHMLAVLSGSVEFKRKDTFKDILKAKDRDTLAEWLFTCPLLHENDGWVMVHAGIYPGWNLAEARTCARELESVLRDDDRRDLYFAHMYGNEPSRWDAGLTGPERWRTITNFFTRMRLLDATGHIDLEHKESLTTVPAHLQPWFRWPGRVEIEKRILFGHWAALEGRTDLANIIALDTGCVWGNRLTAYCLETAAWQFCDCYHPH
ncbi:MAG TPA: symmetrical bis(5'-nucleosyl)-tetraphosphatase [Dongiaceae bacterium]|nr:symmetrical bis(5'-nucleosyl)-tetraphosphatase [Dongiaceae bacterium]